MDSINPLVRLVCWLHGFLQPHWVGLALGAVSAVGGIMDAFGSDDEGGGSDTGALNKWHLLEQDNAWRQANAKNRDYTNALAAFSGGQARSLYDQGMGLNWQPYMHANQQAGDMYSGLAPLYTQYGDRFAGLGDTIWQYGQRMMDAGFDPQDLLRKRLAQQTQQQSRAASTARGLGTSPYAAGLESQALSNFDIDWENNLLQRMGMGLQGGIAANQMGGQDFTTAMMLYQMAPQMLQQGAMAPLQARQNQLAYQQGQLGQYGQNIQNYQLAPLSAFQQLQIPYLYQGQGALNSANQQFNTDRAFNAQQQSSGMNAAFQGIGAINDAWNNGSFGQAFGGGGGSSSGSNLANAFNTATPSQWSAAFGY